MTSARGARRASNGSPCNGDPYRGSTTVGIVAPPFWRLIDGRPNDSSCKSSWKSSILVTHSGEKQYTVYCHRPTGRYLRVTRGWIAYRVSETTDQYSNSSQPRSYVTEKFLDRPGCGAELSRFSVLALTATWFKYSDTIVVYRGVFFICFGTWKVEFVDVGGSTLEMIAVDAGVASGMKCDWK